MIQPVKLDSSAVPRDVSQGDARDGGFSTMLANLVKPDEQAKAMGPAPRAQAGSRPRDAKSQDVRRSESLRSPDSPDKPEAPSAPSSQRAAADPSRTDETRVRRGAEASQPKDRSDSQATAEPADRAASPEATPGSPQAQSTERPSDQAETKGAADDDQEMAKDQPASEQNLMDLVASIASALMNGLSPKASSPGTAEGTAAETGCNGAADQASGQEGPAATTMALSGFKPAMAHKAMEEAKNAQMASAAAKGSASEGLKGDSETPTLQTAEAALGLQSPASKAAMAELMSRPGPVVETPSVVQTIQDARNAGSQQAAPLLTELPKVALPQGSAPSPGNESNGNPSAPPQTHTTSDIIPTGFSLTAPTSVQGKTSIPEASTIRPSLPMEQMEGTVRWILKNDQNSAELQLRPESLGKVQIQLKVEGNQVHAKVWASEPSTVPLLESHRGMLENSLREQGLSLGSFDLHHGQGSPRNPMEQASTQASFTGPLLDISPEPVQEIPVPTAPARSKNHRVEVFA